jgi:hypothetical protein
MTPTGRPRLLNHVVDPLEQGNQRNVIRMTARIAAILSTERQKSTATIEQNK